MSLIRAVPTLGAAGDAASTHRSPFFFKPTGGALARRINSDTALPKGKQRTLA